MSLYGESSEYISLLNPSYSLISIADEYSIDCGPIYKGKVREEMNTDDLIKEIVKSVVRDAFGVEANDYNCKLKAKIELTRLIYTKKAREKTLKTLRKASRSVWRYFDHAIKKDIRENGKKTHMSEKDRVQSRYANHFINNGLPSELCLLFRIYGFSYEEFCQLVNGLKFFGSNSDYRLRDCFPDIYINHFALLIYSHYYYEKRTPSWGDLDVDFPNNTRFFYYTDKENERRGIKADDSDPMFFYILNELFNSFYGCNIIGFDKKVNKSIFNVVKANEESYLYFISKFSPIFI